MSDQQPAFFDLSTLDTAKLSDEGVVMHFRHPETNEKLPLWVRLKGADSEAYQRVADASLNEVFKQIAKAGKVNRTAADTREEQVNSVCAMITEWGGFSKNGEALELTDANKKEIFGWRGYGWALAQANTFILDRANFLPK